MNGRLGADTQNPHVKIAAQLIIFSPRHMSFLML